MDHKITSDENGVPPSIQVKVETKEKEAVRPKYDQLIELLDTLVKWQTFGTFLTGIERQTLKRLKLTHQLKELTNKKLLYLQNGLVYILRHHGKMCCLH